MNSPSSDIVSMVCYLDNAGEKHNTEAEAIQSNAVRALTAEITYMEKNIQRVFNRAAHPRETALWLLEFYNITNK